MAASDEWIHYSDEVRYEVSKMTTEHPARIIREAARHVIDRSHHEDNGSKKALEEYPDPQPSAELA